MRTIVWLTFQLSVAYRRFICVACPSARTRSVTSIDRIKTPSGMGWMPRMNQPTLPSGYTKQFSKREGMRSSRQRLISEKTCVSSMRATYPYKNLPTTPHWGGGYGSRRRGSGKDIASQNRESEHPPTCLQRRSGNGFHDHLILSNRWISPYLFFSWQSTLVSYDTSLRLSTRL